MDQFEDQDKATAGTDIGVFLDHLGFMPTSAVPMTANDASGISADQPMQLEDWVYGNRNIIGLLEEDLIGINPLSWLT